MQSRQQYSSSNRHHSLVHTQNCSSKFEAKKQGSEFVPLFRSLISFWRQCVSPLLLHLKGHINCKILDFFFFLHQIFHQCRSFFGLTLVVIFDELDHAGDFFLLDSSILYFFLSSITLVIFSKSLVSSCGKREHSLVQKQQF